MLLSSRPMPKTGKRQIFSDPEQRVQVLKLLLSKRRQTKSLNKKPKMVKKKVKKLKKRASKNLTTRHRLNWTHSWSQFSFKHLIFRCLTAR